MNRYLLPLIMSAIVLISCKKKDEAGPQTISLKNPTKITYSIKSDSLNQDSNLNYVAYTPSNLQALPKVVHENLLETEYSYEIERPDTGTILILTGKQILDGGNTRARILINEKIVAEYISPSGARAVRFNLSYKF